MSEGMNLYLVDAFRSSHWDSESQISIVSAETRSVALGLFMEKYGEFSKDDINITPLMGLPDYEVLYVNYQYNCQGD